jgi:hypothetical protein
MLVEEYIQMDGEDLIEEELNNAKLMDMALEVVEASPSKVLGKLDKMGDANLNKQQQRTLDSYLKSS